MQEEENNGISLGDIFRTILKAKWVTLAVALLITVAGVLVIQFAYNKSKTEYVSSFGLTLPGDTGSAVYTYPDGTILHYADIVSYPALSEVKESDGEFSGINIEALVNDQAISIVRTVDETKSVTYTVTAKAQYFKDYKTARSFLVAVVNRPINYISEINLTYDSYLSLADGADDYESRISYLGSQLDYVLYEFEHLSKTYGGNFIVSGKTLTSFVNEIKAYKEKDRLTLLANRVRSDVLLKTEASRDDYKLKEIEVKRQLKLAQDTLDKLTSVQGGSGSITYLDASVIKTQADLVGSLTQQLSDIQNYINNGTVDTAFAAQIDKESAELEGFTQSLKTSVSEVYEKTSQVTFLNVNAVASQGGMGLIAGIVLSLVIGIVLALIVGFIVGKYAFGNGKKAGAPPVLEEALNEAAATEDKK